MARVEGDTADVEPYHGDAERYLTGQLPELGPAASRKKKKKSKVVRQIARSNFLGNSLKEQAILFALGLAAKQLKTFITDLNNSNDKEGSE